MPHKLLLADDSVTIQRVIELTFADEDFQVIAVGDGKQAIQRIQSDRPDIVLADIGMPERDGYDVAAFVKGTPEFAHIPVLLLTGAFEPIDEARARAAGCDGVLVKPFEPQLVISRVKDLIERRRAPVAAPAAPATPQGSIEDYFDRLDAAFSTLDGPHPSAAPASQVPMGRQSFETNPPLTTRNSDEAPPGYSGLAEELAGWDPDIGIQADPESLPRTTNAADQLSWGVADAAPAVTSAQVFPSEPVALTPVVPPPVVPHSVPHVVSPMPPTQAAALPEPVSLADAFASLLAAEQGQAFSPAAGALRAPDDAMIEQITQRVIERLGESAVKDTVLDVAERLVRQEIERIKSHVR
ncbi:MAG TPA: response regulator [Vicinamibacterales bacterium]|nr:response regulator [Vicinamibacterales bacterium]